MPNWWAVEAIIASYNHVYQIIYNTRYEDCGIVGVSIYGKSPIAPYPYEFLALNADPQAVIEAIRNYTQGAQDYVLDVFHSAPSPSGVKAEYQRLGYQFIRTGPILGLALPAKARSYPRHVHHVKTLKQLELANESLAEEGEYISPKTLRQPHIHTFIAEMEGQAVGWAQLVTIYPGVGYLHQLYVLRAYRRRKLGRALVRRAQVEAFALGMKHMVVVPTDISLGMYRRLGYQPLAYFTAFCPKNEDIHEAETLPGLGNHQWGKIPQSEQNRA
jgi:ribosomal protein S18 acetylase RimI-like enzyme